MNNHYLVSVIVLFAVGLIMYNTKKSLGIRNNNAGNIRATGNWQEWQGAIGQNQGFIVFDTPENGLRALARVLRTYRNNYGLNTVNEIISRWAPPSENNTASYVNHVSQVLGVQPNQSLDDTHYPLLIEAIVKHENGEQPYSYAQINTGFQLGFA